MLRTVIEIDEEKCDGCGICADACHEGAIAIVDGKAKLIRDDFCDGLGDCLPACPTGAITFIEREAAAYDGKAVAENKRRNQEPHSGGNACPGSAMRTFARQEESASDTASTVCPTSQLANWPVQIKLAPPTAPYFDGAHLLVAADCCAYAYGSFHQDFIRGKVALIGCPKLDNVDYTEKLAAIIGQNNIRSLTICRMEVPCCGGLEYAATQALQASGKFIPWNVVTFSLDGKILE
ncbi:MAG: ATP-binding protein [Eggerthellaceae bacterium]|jgi:ferredoxin